MKNNQFREAGFTLVEIIIALAIMSIVSVAAGRFLTSVVTQYAKDNKDIKLQTEVEEILNLMENVIMSADSVEIYESLNSGTSVNSGAVIRVNQLSDSGSSGVEEYDLIFVADGNMYESRYDGAGKNIGSHERIYMGTHVQSVKFTLSESGSAVFADVSMAYGGVTYDASRKILLRNLTSDYQSASATQATTAAGSEEQETPQVEATSPVEETTQAETTSPAVETTKAEETTQAEETTKAVETTQAEETTKAEETSQTADNTQTGSDSASSGDTSMGSDSASSGSASTGSASASSGSASTGSDSSSTTGSLNIQVTATTQESWSSLCLVLDVKNVGTESVNLKGLEFRYYYNLPSTTFKAMDNDQGNMTTSVVTLKEALATATGYLSASYNSDVILEAGQTKTLRLYTGAIDNSNLAINGFASSFSKTKGVSVYDAGVLVYGRAPGDEQSSTENGTSSGSGGSSTDTETVDLKLTANQTYDTGKKSVQIYYNQGWIQNWYGPIYEYRFRLSTSEKDIDWSKISVKFYIRMDETKITGTCMPYIELGSGLSASAQHMTTMVHNANFVGTMTGFTANNINSDIVVYFGANGEWNALDETNTYSKSLETIEVYYGDTLVWPKS